MKTHSTNYTNTLITVAADCGLEIANTNPKAESMAGHQLSILGIRPYELTSDDLLFEVFATRNGITETEKPNARAAMFAKPQACLRCSPLVKTQGYGIHHNAQAKIAAIAIESPKYHELLADENVVKINGMRSKRA
ncbi:MAG: hypothetical protein FD163_2243 [Hyphomonadaceae bacterium]|nr:MAG: hypothetical protein FD128_1489 [Hyphomonadaceae bacterium]KAF0183523.1 MAG: hypothetical protein FD163_2243 [Hyphomonadaceae bacterium]